MINDYPARTKLLFIAVLTAVFALSVIFAYIMFNDDSVADDESKAVTYAAIFAIAFIVLNAFLLFIALRASKKIKEAARTKKCPKCGSVTDKEEIKCPECGSVQADEDTYLDPKGPDDTVRPKM